MKPVTLLAAFACALAALPATAQDTEDPPGRTAVHAPADSTPAEPGVPRKGAWSLSFTAPGYSASEGAEFGVWEMVGARTRLGVTLEVLVRGGEQENAGPGQTEAATGLGLGLNVRRFLATEARVAPYLQGRVFGRGFYGRAESDAYETELRSVSAGAEAALGAEWFPARAFSISGHTGVRVRAHRQEQDLIGSDGEPRDSTDHELAFQTFTSTLSVQIHF